MDSRQSIQIIGKESQLYPVTYEKEEKMGVGGLEESRHWIDTFHRRTGLMLGKRLGKYL